jgi:hypothetical protein
MYTVHKKVLKDFRYPKMEKLKMENEILHWQLREKDEKLTQKDKKLKQVTRSVMVSKMSCAAPTSTFKR